tara:strand:- start:6 stop:593 length:588 start_codon:yes stop_codon:yes gene_type:complete
MKILIIAHHRSGSTTLMYGLSQCIKNSISIFEPFTNNKILFLKDHLSNLNNSKTTIIEKHLIRSPYEDLKRNVEFFKEYMLNFDKVIILARKDQIETSKSHNYLVKQQSKGLSVHLSYVLEENLDINKDLIIIKNYQKNLYKFASITKLPIIYYEDLYSGNKNYIEDFLKFYGIHVDNFNLFCEYLNPKNRYRQN